MYKWYLLAMGFASLFLLQAAWMCLPALFPEIAADLDLSILQLGFLWGLVPLGGVLSSIPAGLLGDRFGIRLVIGLGLLLGAVVGASRGIAVNFATLAIFMFLAGLLMPFPRANLPKATRLWFPPRQLGLAMGVMTAGSGIGGALTMMVAATALSPAVGGWRNSLFLFGALLAILSIVWLLTLREPAASQASYGGVGRVSLRESWSKAIRVRELWLYAAAMPTVFGGYVGVIGYLPLYLEGRGLTEIAAHGVTSSFLWGFVGGNVIVPFISDRIGLRKACLIPAALIAGVCFFLLWVSASVPFLTVVAVVGGFLAAGAMVLLTIAPLEMDEIGPKYAGTAIGLLLTSLHIGGFVYPVIGGALAEITPFGAFFFWALGPGLGAAAIWFTREHGPRAKKAAMASLPDTD